MESWSIKIIASVIAVIFIAYLGYVQGRWSKHKEIIYEKKVSIYSELVSLLLEFASECRTREKVKFSEFMIVVKKFTETRNAFFRASLFMTDELHKDLHSKISLADERIANIRLMFERISKIKDGAKEKDLNITFDGFKEQTLLAANDFSSLPGPFSPFIDSIPSIVSMLKRDLGIKVLDSKFYKSKS